MAIPLITKMNIIILGEGGSGKSTVANNILQRKDAFEETHGVSSKNSCTCFKSSVMINSSNYAVTVIEANTVQDIKDHFRSPRECCCNDLTKFHLILYLVKSGRQTQEYYDWISKQTKELSNETRAISALIITFSESMDKKHRDDAEEDLRSSLQVHSLMDVGIYSMGFPRLETLPPMMSGAYKEVVDQDTKKLFEILESSIKQGRVCQKNKLFKSWCGRLYDCCCGCCSCCRIL